MKRQLSSSSLSSSSSSSSSYHRKGKRVQYAVENTEISHLPDEMLQMIVRKLSDQDAVRMSILSKRWMDIWNLRPRLILDLITNRHTLFADRVTKVINKHRGHLESCTIRHYPSRTEVAKLASWIQSVTVGKHTKELKLESCFDRKMKPESESETLLLPPNIFSHHSLTSLSLCRYKLRDTQAFNNCSNLKILKLLKVIISDFSVFSRLLTACSSLEVLALQILDVNHPGMLKIEHNKLQFLQVSYPVEVDRIEVYAPRLHVLDLFVVCEINDLIVAAPNIPFKLNCCVTLHVSYHISSLAQERKDIWHELIVSYSAFQKRYGSLSVVVDLTNPKEVDILKEVFLMWSGEMTELEILFKNNNAPIEEGECSINSGAHNKKLWDDAKPFPDANLQIETVRMNNFNDSNHGEFALASRLVMEGIVTRKLVIKTSSLPPMKKLMTEAAVANLMKVPKGNKYLRIECV